MSKITHEQIRNHFKDNFNANDVKYEDIRIITEYISQQEKQEKLLNQIKDIINRPYDISSMLEESKRYVEIENLIKELENDK